MDYRNKILHGDVLDQLKKLPDGSVQMCVTSPPYWGLRDYGVEGQIGLEKSPEEYISKMVQVFREVKRILRNDGTLWLNIGDSYAGSGKCGQSEEKGSANWQPTYPTIRSTTNASTLDGTKQIHSLRAHENVRTPHLKPKDLIGIPWMLAFSLRADGWYLRQDIIWHKPNPMPESVNDRCTKSHEYIFLLSKSKKYYYDVESIKEPQVEYERARRLREKEQGLDTVYKIGRDGQTGTADQSKTGAVRNTKRRQELAEKGLRNKRSVWTIITQPFPEAHFATFPEELPMLCIKAGSRENDLVLDPFGGAGTTGLVANKLNRDFVMIELNEKYISIAKKRLKQELGMFSTI